MIRFGTSDRVCQRNSILDLGLLKIKMPRKPNIIPTGRFRQANGKRTQIIRSSQSNVLPRSKLSDVPTELVGGDKKASYFSHVLTELVGSYKNVSYSPERGFEAHSFGFLPK